ncbi:uncharacterized protein LOC101849004 [Aplysia californica]|uniref:Uncharacterized protein LOC101849004 n=1 Tax=Aplysia californica TaxID=6500 RepID=A0ABM0K4Z3_APLCA|nr:uncharacterized protein LOC101849004 [Aplysia californica]
MRTSTSAPFYNGGVNKSLRSQRLNVLADSMMPSPTVQGAVSEYEHLSYKYSRFGPERDSIWNEDEKGDFIPLKPPKHSLQSSSSSVPSMTTDRNFNNPNTNLASSSLKSYIPADDETLSAKGVPSPLAWSPGMLAGPSIFLTPEKSLGQDWSSKSSKENILEPHDTNQIPVPMAWSPGMNVKLNPSLFVTPEKPLPKYLSVVKDNFALDSAEIKENLEDQTSDLKTKGKHSVRFDLPSASSGDETSDSVDFANMKSPITLKGRELSSSSNFESPSSGSPQWKPLSPPKSYDPNAYSDESVLEDSLALHGPQTYKSSEMSLPSLLTFASTSKTASLTISPSDGDSGISIEPGTLQKEGKSLSNRKTNRKTIIKTKPSADSCTRKSIINSQSDLPGNFVVLDNLKTRKKKKQAGPQFLKSALSQYDKNPPKPFIIRESKNKHVEAEYSYPFDGGKDVGDSEFEHAFARPEFNSTLRVRSELDDLCEQEVDVQAAVLDTLAKSELKRTEMNEKASLYTNHSSDQFHNLVDLDTSVETLCERIVRMRTSKATGKKKASLYGKKPIQSDRAPDLMEFFSPELQRETPDLSLPGVSYVTSKLLTSPHDIAFDLYRHNRLWNGINDF